MRPWAYGAPRATECEELEVHAGNETDIAGLMTFIIWTL
jgi:hypothetical protein